MRPLVPLVLMATLASTAHATDTSVEERLRLLEERVMALESENARLRDDVAPKPNAPATVKAVGKESEIKLGGLLQVQAESGGRADSRFTDDNDRTYLRRARVNVGGRFLEEVEWRTEVELAGSLSNASGVRAQLTDGYVAWKRKEPLELKAGQFKTPFGFEHLWSDPRLACSERTIGSDRLTLGRQVGVQIGGTALDKRVAWSVGAFNGTPANTSGNDDDRSLVAARVSGTPAAWRIGRKDARWSLGLNGYGSRDASVTLGSDFRFDSNPTAPGNDNVFSGRRSGLGADTQLALGPFELWAEWLTTDFRPTSELPAPSFDASARSLQATYLTWKDRLQWVARWDAFDPNGEADDDGFETWTSGLTWLIRGHDLKLQAHWMDVSGPKPLGDEDVVILRFQLAF